MSFNKVIFFKNYFDILYLDVYSFKFLSFYFTDFIDLICKMTLAI